MKPETLQAEVHKAWGLANVLRRFAQSRLGRQTLQANVHKPVVEVRPFTCWALIQRAEDIEDQWIAHCLDVDVVTQGSSAQHAFEMVYEATRSVLYDDIAGRREPLSRRAPDEFWDVLWRVVQAGEKIEDVGGEVPGADVRIAVCFVTAAHPLEDSGSLDECPRPELVCRWVGGSEP